MKLLLAKQPSVRSRKGRRIKAPKERPDGKGQISLADADSGLIRKSKQHEYHQTYNAHTVVDVDGSQLVCEHEPE